MPFFTDNIRAGASGATTGYQIERSLRMDGSDGYLLRTPTSTGNRKIWTWSGWVKRSKLDNNDYIFSCNSQSGNDGIAAIYWKSGNNKLQFYFDTDGSNPYGDVNDRDYRDVGAWYHIVWQVDASNTTHRIWVNGVEENITGGQPPNYSYAMNRSGYVQAMGSQGWDSHTNRGHMYFAECHYSDGYKYEASDFGEINSETGVWSPKEDVNITYGTNGFYLKFDDNSNNTAATIGKDSSGNGNNWTPVGIVTGDAVKDTPTNNFCTFNQLSNYDDLTLAEGGLKATATSTWDMVRSTMGVSSGKWYFEVRCNSAPDNEGWMAGIHEVFARDNDGYWIYNGTYTAANYGYAYAVQDNNQRRKNATGDDAFDTGDIQPGDVVGIRMDLDNNELLISVNGSDKGKMYDIQSGITYAPFVDLYSGASATLNCGQDSTFHGQETAGGNSDSGGIGDFAYAVPSGYKAICSANLSTTIDLPDKHFDTVLYTGTGSSQNITGLEFQPDWVSAKRRDGTASGNVLDSVRGVRKHMEWDSTDLEQTEDAGKNLTSFNSDGFTLGGSNNGSGRINYNGNTFVAWCWNAGNSDGKTYTVKVVSDSGNKYRFDDFGTSAVTLDLAEGGTYIFDQSDSSNSGHPLRFSTTSNGTHGGGSEYTTGVTTSGTPGSSGAYTQIVVAASAPTLYYYCTQHSGMGGQANTNSTLGSSNFDGAIQSVAKVNATAGFSIVGYVGNGQDNTDVTVGHGLGVTPAMVIVKKRDSGGSEAQWAVLHQKLTSGKNIFLQTYSGEATYVNYIKSMASSTFTLRTSSASGGRVNRSGNNYIAYVFADVEGYCKFGSYIGNGSSDGIFVYLGFRPAFFVLKAKTSDISWYLYDNKRDPDNKVDRELNPHNSQGEASGHDLDFVSNGVKMRSSDSSLNYNNYEYIYWAFAESPFKYSRAR